MSNLFNVAVILCFQVPTSCTSHLCWLPRSHISYTNLWNIQSRNVENCSTSEELRTTFDRCHGRVLLNVSGGMSHQVCFTVWINLRFPACHKNIFNSSTSLCWFVFKFIIAVYGFIWCWWNSKRFSLIHWKHVFGAMKSSMDAIDINIFPDYFENFFSLCFRRKSEDIHILLVLYQKKSWIPADYIFYVPLAWTLSQPPIENEKLLAWQELFFSQTTGWHWPLPLY